MNMNPIADHLDAFCMLYQQAIRHLKLVLFIKRSKIIIGLNSITNSKEY